METINERMKLLRDALGMNQADFARSVGINIGTMSHIEKNKTRPSFDVIQAVASKVRGLNLYWFIQGKGEMFLKGEGEGQVIGFYESKPEDGGEFGQEIIDKVLSEKDRQFEQLLAEKDRQLKEYRSREEKHLETITALSKR